MFIRQYTFKRLCEFVGFVTYLISLIHGHGLFEIKPLRVKTILCMTTGNVITLQKSA
jgi:hypothetical protein